MAPMEDVKGFTPGPWTNEPGLFFICNVGNNANDPGVWSKALPPDGEPFPFGDKAADAKLIAMAPDLLSERNRLREALERTALMLELALQETTGGLRSECATAALWLREALIQPDKAP